MNDYAEFTEERFKKRQKTFAEREKTYAGEKLLGNFYRVASLFNTLTGKDLKASDVALLHTIDKLDRECCQKRLGDSPDHKVRVDSRNDQQCYFEIYDYLVMNEEVL